MARAGAVWLDVLPSMRGFSKSVATQARTNLAGAGATAGKQYATALTKEGRRGAAAAAAATTAQLQAGAATAAKRVQTESGKVVKARARAADAAGRVRIAEAGLMAARGKYAAGSKQVITAEEGLARAQRAAKLSAGQVATATTGLRGAVTNATGAQQALAQHTATTSTALTGAGKRTGLFRAAMGRAAAGVRGAAAGIRASIATGITSPVGGMIRQIGGLAALVGFGALGVSAVKAAANIDKARRTLTGLYGSGREAADMMQRLRDLSRGSPIEYQAYTDAAGQLAYMGIKGTDAVQTLRNVGSAITAAGGGSQKMQAASNAMLKMVNTGKVYAAQLNQISDAGVPVFSSLAAHYNTNIAHVREMVSAGKVSIDDVMASIRKAEGSTFQSMIAASKNATNSMSAQWAMLKDNIVTGLGEAMRPAVAAVTPVIKRMGVQIGAGFQALPAIMSRVGAVMRETGISTAFAGIGRAVTALAKGAWPILQGALAGMGASFGGIVIMLRPLTALLTRIGNWMAEHATVARVFGAALGIVAAAVVVTKTALIGARVAMWAFNLAAAANPIGLVVAALGALVVGVMYAWKNFGWFRTGVLAVWSALKTGALAVWNVILVAFTAIRTAITTAFQFIWSGWGKWLLPLLGPAGLLILAVIGIAKNWSAIWNGIKAVTSFVWAGIKLVITGAWTVIRAIFTAIRTVVTVVLAPVFLWLYRNIVKPVWTLIRIAIYVAWTLIKVVFGLIRIGIKALGVVFRWLYTAVVKPVWNGIKRAIQAQWALIKIVFNAISGFLKRVLGPVFRWLWHSVIQPVWAGIRRVIAVQWAAIKVVFNAITGFLRRTLGPVFRWLWNSVIKPVWNGIKTTISTVWTRGIKPVFNALWNFVRHSIPNGFRKGVDAVKAAWNKVKAIAKAPVSFILRTVIQKGIVGGFNKIAGVFNVPKIKFTVPKGFAAGGRVRGPGTATSDSIPARLSNNEHVWTAREVQGAGGHTAVERMRAAATRGDGMPFARGGRASLIAFGKWLRKKGARVGEGPAPFGPVHRVHAANSWHYRNGAIDVNYGPGGQSGTEQAFFDKIIKSGIARKSYGLRSIWRYPGHYNHAHFDIAPGGDLGMRQSGKRGLLAGLANAVGAITNPFKGLMDKVKKKMADFGQWGGVLTGGMKKLISGAWDWVKEHNPFAGIGESDGEVVKGGGPVRAIVRKTAKQFGWAKGAQWDALSWLISHESGWRPTAQNPTSTAYGLFQFLNSTWGGVGGKKTSDPAKQALYGMRYIKQRYNSPLGAQRFWRAHHWYDNGGWLYPNTLATNQSGRPEPVLTNKQWQIAEQGLAMQGGGDTHVEVNLRHTDMSPAAISHAWSVAAKRARIGRPR